MEQPDLEIVVSRDPNDYLLEPDGGRELQILDRIIAAKDRESNLQVGSAKQAKIRTGFQWLLDIGMGLI